ncbi:MAG TPA: FKBP-type peptidyl-prolyl cis-trans isomerase [Sphingobacteriaceae bacterium]|nr:FKBP-type peptidyl-prolyl cis-trans isomerase [Sphingobacteriaceae bacterium]
MKSIKLFLILFIATTVIVSCKKEEPEYDVDKQLAAEEITIKNYVTANNIPALRHDKSGIYYVLTSPGTGVYTYSNLSTTAVTVKYSGKFLSGVQFDGNTEGITFGPPQFPNGLNNLINAWKIAMAPKSVGGILEAGLQKGGRIRIITPSPYAYGPNANGKIPANSILDFDIELIDVKNN